MQSPARLLCIDPAIVEKVWPVARDLIRSASLKTGRGHFAKIEEDVLAGRQFLWLAWNGETIEAATTTELIKENDRKICVVVACGGKDRARWLPLLDGIEDFARKEGCAGMRIYGRKGWQRALKGYRPVAVVLGKELN